MATIQNARDVLLQAAATRLETVAGPTNVTTDFANVTGSTRPSNNADVTQTAVNSGVTATSGGITLSSGGAIKGGQTAYDSGNGFSWVTPEAPTSSAGQQLGQQVHMGRQHAGIVGTSAERPHQHLRDRKRSRCIYQRQATWRWPSTSPQPQTGIVAYTTGQTFSAIDLVQVWRLVPVACLAVQAAELALGNATGSGGVRVRSPAGTSAYMRHRPHGNQQFDAGDHQRRERPPLAPASLCQLVVTATPAPATVSPVQRSTSTAPCLA